MPLLSDGMEDNIPYYKRIPLHDGQHRIFEKIFPQRPYNNCVTSTIEVTWTEDFMDNLCVHRADSKKWHGLFENCGEPTYGGCLNAVTTFIDHYDPLDMVVLEGGERIIRGVADPKLYRIPRPTTKGINHIAWCDNMEITHRDPGYLEKLVTKLPESRLDMSTRG